MRRDGKTPEAVEVASGLVVGSRVVSREECIWEKEVMAQQVMLREVGPRVAEYPWELIRRAVCRVLYLQQELEADAELP
jgi:hypothetical protein